MLPAVLMLLEWSAGDGAGMDSIFPVHGGYIARPPAESSGFVACDTGRSSVYLKNQNQSSTGDQYIQG